MEQYYQEPTPVQYSAAGVKKRHYIRSKNGVRLHWHDRMELIRLHRGRMQVGYGENRMLLQPGEVYIVPPKTPHAVKLASDEVEYDVIMFDVRWFYNETEACQSSLRSICSRHIDRLDAVSFCGNSHGQNTVYGTHLSIQAQFTDERTGGRRSFHTAACRQDSNKNR